ncbi:GNAT family acetyltransferase [Clostridiales bacterium PH28_bin88]|nr:GNAT family acetyltransferase [Clostridiales bacterium PH28_bin88]
MIIITFADNQDYEYLKDHDSHIRADILQNKIVAHEVIVLKENNRQIGWLRYSLFFDAVPFMSMLYIEESYRSRGLGKKLVSFWENEMKRAGYTRVMTSSRSDEQAQHFYRKQGYKDSGALLFPGEVLEILFLKRLD